jgi:diguanylate cyclase (GGDEF)-like protein/PAS domain S-box-containing protein
MCHQEALAGEALARLDAQREAILDAVDDAILVMSPVKAVTYLNRGACALFGVHADEAVGQRFERGGVFGRLADLCIAEALRLGKWEGTAKIEDMDGERIRSIYLARFSPVAGRDGGLAGTVIVVEDVTSDEFLRRRLVQEKASLEKTVEVKTRELQDANKRLEALARTDALTGLPNRRMIEEVLATELSRAARYGHSTGLLMIDVDDFKSINDKLGHQVGDDVLRHVASILRRSIRTSDMVGRWGGDEFAVVLPRAGAADCEAVTRRIGENLLIENAAGDRVPGTALGLSVGWAAQAGGDSTALLARADMMMYDCKTAKKARVVRHVTGSD